MKGEPTPDVRWYKDECELCENKNSNYSSIFTKGVCKLLISRLKENDAGRFMCEASNAMGRVSTFARLSVVTDPKLLLADQHLKQ